MRNTQLISAPASEVPTRMARRIWVPKSFKKMGNSKAVSAAPSLAKEAAAPAVPARAGTTTEP
jgi:hypothetical protein